MKFGDADRVCVSVHPTCVVTSFSVRRNRNGWNLVNFEFTPVGRSLLVTSN